MSDVLSGAVAALNTKDTSGFDGTAKFRIEGAGSILIDRRGARAGDADADVTLSADVDTFRALLSGDLDPAAAFMGGRLNVEGDMGMAMALGSVLA